MASEYINVYMNNPTAEAKDGTPVSTDGTYTAPIEALLNKGKSESQTIKLALRTADGYITINRTYIYTQKVTDDIAELGTDIDNIKLSWNEFGSFSTNISTEEMIDSTNKIFYVKVNMQSTETQQVDRSLRLVVVCSVIRRS